MTNISVPAADTFLTETIKRVSSGPTQYEPVLYGEDRLSVTASIAAYQRRNLIGNSFGLVLEPTQQGMHLRIHGGETRNLLPFLAATRATALDAGTPLLIRPSATAFDAYWLVASDPNCVFDESLGAWRVQGEQSHQHNPLSVDEVVATLNPSSTPFHRLYMNGSGWGSRKTTAGTETNGFVSVKEGLLGFGKLASTGISGVVTLSPKDKEAYFEGEGLHSPHFLQTTYGSGLARLNKHLKQR